MPWGSTMASWVAAAPCLEDPANIYEAVIAHHAPAWWFSPP